MTETHISKVDRNETALVLGVLSAIEQDSWVTQRGLSSELGIALGLANAVLKRCVRKGLIKIATAPLNRYAYYLTPSGFTEKARLTAEYLRVSFNLFRDARRQFTGLFADAAAHDARRIVLLGVSDLSEAALLSAREAGVEIVGVVDPARAGSIYLGVPVSGDTAAFVGRIDALAVCDLENPVAVHNAALAFARELGLDRTRVLTPALLRLGNRRARRELDA